MIHKYIDHYIYSDFDRHFLFNYTHTHTHTHTHIYIYIYIYIYNKIENLIIYIYTYIYKETNFCSNPFNEPVNRRVK